MNLRGIPRREFSTKVRKQAFIRCCRDGIPYCESCGNEIRQRPIFEHIQADGLQGEPVLENCKIYCKICADIKTHTQDNTIMQKADRVLKRTYGIAKSRNPMPGSRGSKWKKKMNGKVVLR